MVRPCERSESECQDTILLAVHRLGTAVALLVSRRAAPRSAARGRAARGWAQRTGAHPSKAALWRGVLPAPSTSFTSSPASTRRTISAGVSNVQRGMCGGGQVCDQSALVRQSRPVSVAARSAAGAALARRAHSCARAAAAAPRSFAESRLRKPAAAECTGARQSAWPSRRCCVA